MKDIYTIKRTYPERLPGDEIEISSENLYYSELGYTHSGCQTKNIENNDKIHKLCVKVSELIKEIDVLQHINKTDY